MNKEDILKKARHQNNALDEREESIYLKSYLYSLLSMIMICIIYMCIKIQAQLPYSDVYSVFTIGMSISHLYKGVKLRKTLDICLGLCWFFITGTLIYTYCLDVLG